MSPGQAVQHQLDAYNDRDLERFLAACYRVVDGLIRTVWFLSGD